jgi:hypothetical protein
MELKELQFVKNGEIIFLTFLKIWEKDLLINLLIGSTTLRIIIPLIADGPLLKNKTGTNLAALKKEIYIIHGKFLKEFQILIKLKHNALNANAL